MTVRRAGVLAFVFALATALAAPSGTAQTCSAACRPAAKAAASRIAVDPGDTPLRIQGFVGENSGFAGAIRVHATGAAIGSYQALFSDLRGAGVVVSRSHLALSGATTLARGQYADLKVTIDGIEDPGDYRAQLELVPAGQPRRAATVVPIEVSAIGRPTLTALAPDDRVHGALARCGISCDITAFLVPGSAGAKSQTLQLAVGARRVADVTGLQVLGAGDKNGHQLTNADLNASAASVASPITSTDGLLTLHFRINPGTLPPDHYTGTLRLTLANVDEPVTVPIDFTVRDSPYLAILMLFIGIALGRAGQRFARTGTQRRDLYARAGLLRRRARRIRNDDLEAAVAEAQAAIDDDDLAYARTIMDDAEQGRYPGRARTAERAAAERPPLTPGRAIAAIGHWIAHAAAWLSPVRTELDLGAHIVGAATWLGLLFIGYQTLYIQQGASFGANGIFDYVALVLWGLSADVAGRSLGNLTGSGDRAGAAAA